ncbi:SdrD B-like domain-containing protein [Amycolatopsis sp. NPDC059657]|uniref:MSCRAMM family protein n=1 Tax=Amycolatopsis sp. NPDC059657 TaxID=3346899 RepID=UPI00366F6504
MSKTPLRGVTRLFAVVAAALTIGALTSPVASAAPIKLVLTASVGDETRLVDKPFEIKLTVTNKTDQAMHGVKADVSTLTGSSIIVTDWNGLADTRPTDPGVTVDAGATRTFTLIAHVWRWEGTPQVKFKTNVPTSYQQVADLTIPMVDPTTTSGTITGVVYGDSNGNREFDEGEGLADAKVSVFAPDQQQTITDSDGWFTFPDMPARRYSLSVRDLPDGWVLAKGDLYVDVDSDQDADVNIRSVRPVSDSLHVNVSLDRDVYAPGDTAHVTFTLTNDSAVPLLGIQGWCDRAGGSQQGIEGWKSWADLVYPAKVDLAPGESRTFTEVGTVPQVANQYGGFVVDCDFGPEGGEEDGFPAITLWGKVPGAPGDTSGWIYHDDDHDLRQDPGEAIADTTVELVDDADEVVATGTTDAEGHVVFPAVAAGRYTLKVDGWVAEDTSTYQIQAGTCQSCAWEWSLVYKAA